MQEHNITPCNSLQIVQGKDNNIEGIKPAFDFDKYSIGVKDIQAEAEQLIRHGTEAKESIGLFTVKPANRWIEQAKTRPIFSGRWITSLSFA